MLRPQQAGFIFPEKQELGVYKRVKNKEESVVVRSEARYPREERDRPEKWLRGSERKKERDREFSHLGSARFDKCARANTDRIR